MKIDHLAIAVEDLESATAFYTSVFGFEIVREGQVRDHYSRHMTDGNIDIALIRYDPGASSDEATAAGGGPGIHHIGFGVEDVDECVRLISEAGVLPIKFRTPDGVVAEFAPAGHYDRTRR
jgi:lactoylglutathione lyase